MSDIFISYKREDRPRARQLALALEQQGFSVWWDRNIPPGKSFDRVIQEALDQATCIVVLWSEASVDSDWVKEEAEKGASRGVLVPILIDDVSVPLGFGRIQTANLVGWQGEAANPDFVQVTASIRRIIQGCDSTFQIVREALVDPAWKLQSEASPPPRRPLAASRSKPRRARSGSRPVLWAAVAVVLSVCTGVAGFYFARTAPPPAVLDNLAAAPPTPAEVVASVQPIPAATDPIPAVETGPDAENLSPIETHEAEPSPEPEETVDPAVEAYRKLFELEERSQDPDADVAELLREYEELLARHRQSLDADAASGAERKIASLKGSIEEAEAVQSLEQRDDLTVGERLARLRGLASSNPDGKLAAARIAELEEIVESSATITADDHFVTGKGVDRRDETLVGPTGVGEAFRPGQVYVFAWVNAPRAQETLTLEWIAGDGDVAKTEKVKVFRNTGAGYRFFYSKQHPAAGRYEVRLYNEGGALIGRRVFEVG